MAAAITHARRCVAAGSGGNHMFVLRMDLPGVILSFRVNMSGPLFKYAGDMDGPMTYHLCWHLGSISRQTPSRRSAPAVSPGAGASRNVGTLPRWSVWVLPAAARKEVVRALLALCLSPPAPPPPPHSLSLYISSPRLPSPSSLSIFHPHLSSPSPPFSRPRPHLELHHAAWASPGGCHALSQQLQLALESRPLDTRQVSFIATCGRSLHPLGNSTWRCLLHFLEPVVVLLLPK